MEVKLHKTFTYTVQSREIKLLRSSIRLTSWLANLCRWMLGLSCVPSTIMFVLFIFMPKSARWLYFQGHVEQAKAILIEVRIEKSLKNIDIEINQINRIFTFRKSLKYILLVKGNRRCFIWNERNSWGL